MELLGYPLVVALLSGMVRTVAGAFIAVCGAYRFGKIQQKQDVLRRTMANRHLLFRDTADYTDETCVAPHEAQIVHVDSKDVIDALMDLHNLGPTNERFMKLLTTMGQSAKINVSNLGESSLVAVFTPSRTNS